MIVTVRADDKLKQFLCQKNLAQTQGFARYDESMSREIPWRRLPYMNSGKTVQRCTKRNGRRRKSYSGVNLTD